jgi:hypothetical protein
MVSFRSKKGTWLALTTLALQLVLSFTHVHFAGAFSPHCGAVISGTTIETYKLPIRGKMADNATQRVRQLFGGANFCNNIHWVVLP